MNDNCGVNSIWVCCACVCMFVCGPCLSDSIFFPSSFISCIVQMKSINVNERFNVFVSVYFCERASAIQCTLYLNDCRSYGVYSFYAIESSLHGTANPKCALTFYVIIFNIFHGVLKCDKVFHFNFKYYTLIEV